MSPCKNITCKNYDESMFDGTNCKSAYMFGDLGGEIHKCSKYILGVDKVKNKNEIYNEMLEMLKEYETNYCNANCITVTRCNEDCATKIELRELIQKAGGGEI